MKLIDACSMLKPKKAKIQKSDLVHFGLKLSKPVFVSLRKPCPWEKSGRILITLSYLNTTPKVLL